MKNIKRVCILLATALILLTIVGCGQSKHSLGETISSKSVDITFTSSEFGKYISTLYSKISDSPIEGSYYYEAKNSDVYLLVKFNLTNNSSNKVRFDYQSSYLTYEGKYKYDALISINKSVDPLKSVDGGIAFELPDTIRNSDGSIVLTACLDNGVKLDITLR